MGDTNTINGSSKTWGVLPWVLFGGGALGSGAWFVKLITAGDLGNAAFAALLCAGSAGMAGLFEIIRRQHLQQERCRAECQRHHDEIRKTYDEHATQATSSLVESTKAMVAMSERATTVKDKVHDLEAMIARLLDRENP